MSSAATPQHTDNKPAERIAEEVQENVKDAKRAEERKESFFDEVKRKLFPKHRGRDRPAESLKDKPGTPATATTPPASEAAAATEAGAEATPAATAASSPEQVGEKKSWLDKIKDMFKGKNKKGENEVPAAAAAGTQAGSAGEPKTAADAVANGPPASQERAMEHMPEEDKPMAVSIGPGGNGAGSQLNNSDAVNTVREAEESERAQL